MLNDHAPILREQQRREAENAYMKELERHSAPLLWMFLCAIVLAAVFGLLDGLLQKHQYEKEYAALKAKHAELAAQNEAFIRCLNGQPVGLGDAVLRCRIKPQEPGERL